METSIWWLKPLPSTQPRGKRTHTVLKREVLGRDAADVILLDAAFGADPVPKGRPDPPRDAGKCREQLA